jgi:hypothetical protein
MKRKEVAKFLKNMSEQLAFMADVVISMEPSESMVLDNIDAFRRIFDRRVNELQLKVEKE